MEALKKLQDFIKSLDEREFWKYTLIFFAILLVLLSLIFYVHYRRVNKYKQMLTEVNKERLRTKEILTNFRLVNQQKEKVDEILARDKSFFIGQTFNNILQKLKLNSHLTEEPKRTDGDTISGKIERSLTATLDNITMKQLTELLSAIAEIERLYPKELTIKKISSAQAVDVELTIATLEPVPETD